MKVRRSLLKDRVTVAAYLGEGAAGPVYADPVTVACSIDETRRMVRDTSGDEQVSEATLILHPATRVLDEHGNPAGVVDPMQRFAPESSVQIRGRDSRVLASKPHTIRGRTAAVEVTCA